MLPPIDVLPVFCKISRFHWVPADVRLNEACNLLYWIWLNRAIASEQTLRRWFLPPQAPFVWFINIPSCVANSGSILVFIYCLLSLISSPYPPFILLFSFYVLLKKCHQTFIMFSKRKFSMIADSWPSDVLSILFYIHPTPVSRVNNFMSREFKWIAEYVLGIFFPFSKLRPLLIVRYCLWKNYYLNTRFPIKSCWLKVHNLFSWMSEDIQKYSIYLFYEK